MRIRRLDLTRYGIFTDHAIDFGHAPSDGPDLHLVYGPNEAGKSTTLAAFLDLLFGIDARSRYGFLHQYSAMQIGGVLNTDGEDRELVRTKKNQNSLLGPDGQPVGEGIVAAAVGGIDRDAYRTMFSLDDDTLEEGGDSILASQGDLGELLFSASAGLAELSRSLAEIREDVDAFHRTGARKTELGELKRRLKELKAQRDEIDVRAPAFARLVEERDRAIGSYGEAMDERSRIEAQRGTVRALLDALPRLNKLQAARETLAELSDLPEPPAGWPDEIAGLRENDARLETEVAGLDREIARLKADLVGIDVDQNVVELSGRIERLPDLRARHVTAVADIPNRQLDLKEAEGKIKGALHRMERPDAAQPEALVLPASTVGALRDLSESRSGIKEQLRSARAERDLAEEQLEKARSKLMAVGGEDDSDGETAQGDSHLRSLVAELRRDDQRARGELASKRKARVDRVLAERIERLRPWAGGADDLARMATPEPEQLRIWKARVEAAAQVVQRRDDTVEGLETDRERLQARISAIEESAGDVGDAWAEQVRAARDAAWSVHRAALDEATAETFEGRLREDDDLTGTRLRRSEDVARLRQARETLAEKTAELERAVLLQTEATEQVRALVEEIATAVEAMAVPGTTPLPSQIDLVSLEAWLERRDKALETWREIGDCDLEVEEAKAAAHTVIQRLLDALAAVEIPHDSEAGLEALLELAEAGIERARTRRIERQVAGDEVEAREGEARSRARDLEVAIAKDEKWRRSWAKTISTCWLGEDGALPATGSVRQILVENDALASALEQRNGFDLRIRKMREDQEAFVGEVGSIATALGEPFVKDAALDAYDSLAARLERARRNQQTAEAKTHEREDAIARRHKAVDRLAGHEALKAEMTTHFAVETLREVDEKLSQVSRRADCSRLATELGREIVDVLNCASLEEAEEALAGADRDALELQRAELEARFKDQDQRARDLFAIHSKSADAVEAVLGDGVAARIEEQIQTLLLEIEEKALAHLRLRVGIEAAELALRAYRDKHRSSMLEHASEAFQIVSRGAYARLSTQPEKGGESLIGVTAGGGSKMAVEMSRGTRFQLYLAMRVAGYREFAKLREPPPFIGDDILETFDDFRAEEAFRLFADMAGVGQVIYLTHHRHLCEIAQEVCPSVKVHELPKPA